MTAIPLDTFDSELKSRYTEVSSSAIGARVLAVSDDFFASVHDLIIPKPAQNLKGQYGPEGALYDGWESRRHNPEFDWTIIRLAPASSSLHYVDVDTSHFAGNECPAAQVFGILSTSEVTPEDDWVELLPVVQTGPNARHIFELNDAAKNAQWNAVMVRMIPDGGMARFRAYGTPSPPALLAAVPGAETAPVNLLDPLFGARSVSFSDANYNPPSNLLRPGRGHDMSDGWETTRARPGRGKYAAGQPMHGTECKEWAVFRLASPGVLRHVEIDSAFHLGNYPVQALVEAALSETDEPDEWTTLVSRSKLGPHRQHWLAVDNAATTQVFSHVRLSIYPDGGLKRFRVFGHPVSPSSAKEEDKLTVTAMPLTPEAFAPYGQVVQAFAQPTSAPKGVQTRVANDGSAVKYMNLADVGHSYAPESLTRGGAALACMRAGPQYDVRGGARIAVSKLERHAKTTQAFIPLSRPQIHQPGGTFLVVVALNGPNDEPDLSTLKAFIPTAQGVSYNEGVWHHPMLTLNAGVDYACLDAQTGLEGQIVDCETLHNEWADVWVPPYDPIVPPAPAAPATPAATARKLSFGAINLFSNLQRPVPIDHANFKPFGELVRAYPDPSAAPAGVLHGGNAALEIVKTSWLSNLVTKDGTAEIGVFRAQPRDVRGRVLDVKVLERHRHTSQALVPMGKGQWEDRGETSLPDGGCVLVIVAENGRDDRPDLATLKTFIMPAGTALNYRPGVWHHPLLVLDAPLDVASIDSGADTDCDVVRAEGDEVFARIAVPGL